MMPKPTKERLRIMWQVAVTSAIEGQGETWEIFANLLHNHYFGSEWDHITLHEEP